MADFWNDTMAWLNKLPSCQRTPYGFELRLLRMMPSVLVVGTLLPAGLAGLARFFYSRSAGIDVERLVQTFDFVMVGVVVTIWTAVFTIAIGCVIVWLMKGPAYVADGYEVSHSDNPKSSHAATE
jgi:hypothetical protein